jgi:hypothetical protein
MDHATLWFTTSYFAASLLLSLLANVIYRRAPRARGRPLPPYPEPRAATHAVARAANRTKPRVQDQRRVLSG